jgi:S1-C subfamily serine protease
MRLGKLFLFLIVPLLACSAICPKVNGPELARMESSSTVSLIYPMFSNMPFCTGTFVSENGIILTANHCLEGLAERINKNFEPEENEGDAHDIISELLPKVRAKDLKIPFVMEREMTGVGQLPAAIHYSRVMYLDHDTDLALLAPINPDSLPTHTYGKLADHSPAIGSTVSCVGSPHGLYGTFIQGTVSAYRDDMSAVGLDLTGPWLQASIPVYFGNSGGSLYDDDGNICGVSSFIAPVPITAFFVSLPTIRKLLIEQEVIKR